MTYPELTFPDFLIVRGVDFGGIVITCADDAGDPFALAGWTATAQAKLRDGSPVAFDLGPVIAADDSAGTITIPAIDRSVTALISCGQYSWDLIVIDGNDVSYGPITSGAVTVMGKISTITDPTPPI